MFPLSIFSNKTSTYDLFIFVVIFFALLAQGSYFPGQYLTILMTLSILLLFKIISLKKHINITITHTKEHVAFSIKRNAATKMSAGVGGGLGNQ